MERGGGHADDRQGVVVDFDDLAHDVRVGAELAVPQAVAEDDHGVAAGRGLIGRQDGAAQLRADAEHAKVIPGDEFGRHDTRAAALAQGGLEQARAHEVRKRGHVLTQVLIVGIRHAELATGVGLGRHHHEPGRPIDAGQGRDGQALEHGEDGGVEADADREDRDDRE